MPLLYCFLHLYFNTNNAELFDRMYCHERPFNQTPRKRGLNHLILMDIQMPEKDGYEVTRTIREQEAGQRRIPIIALTANALNGDREECIKQGMDDDISKPLDTSALEELIKKHIGN
jgi:CheY-like chemotaxis protein